nr:mechanosensitive ion channel domain-containing protein [Bacteroides sp. 214]
MLETLLESAEHLGIAIIKAIIIFVIGQLIIKLINKFVKRLLSKKNIDPSVRTFTANLVNITLIILLIISIVGALGIQTTSFAALLASVGVALGMALSGNLSNFAGGLIILLFKPFRVGDFIDAQSASGTVTEIQIFHTILNTSDNIRVYIPNGALSSGVVKNFNIDKRRAEWIIGIEYGEDFDRAKAVVEKILREDSRVLIDPAPFIALNALDSSSVNLIIRAWANNADYWNVYFDMNKAIYDAFNKENINFPFPQMTIHQA